MNAAVECILVNLPLKQVLLLAGLHASKQGFSGWWWSRLHRELAAADDVCMMQQAVLHECLLRLA